MEESKSRVARRSSRPSATLIIKAAAVALVGVALVGSALRMLSTVAGATAEADSARNELLAGAAMVKSSATTLTPEQGTLADSHFRSAEAHFAHLHAVLSQGPVMGVARRLPWFGTQARAAEYLADIGVHLSRTGELAVQAITVALAEVPAGASAHSNPGQRVLQTLQALDPKLGQMTTEIDLAAVDRARIPTTGLLPQLQNALTQLDNKVNTKTLRDGIMTFRAQEPALQRLLGAPVAQTYLVLQQDPAELRATGGFIGSVGFLSFDQGKLAPFDPVDVSVIDRTYQGALYGFGASTNVAVPPPLAKTFHLTSLALRDSNWSPDFRASAQEAELLLKQESGRTVDGVVAIDPYLIGRLLTVVGPITVPETGDTVDANNFFSTTLNRVELNQTTNRKSFLSYAAKAIFSKLLVMPPKQWLPMLQVLSWGCASRSLQAYFHDPEAEALVNRYHCGGQIEPLSSDGVMVVTSNVGGNKDDFWLQRTYDLKIGVNADGSAKHTLHIHYSGLSPHGVQLTKYWGYTGWLRIYLPPSSGLVLSSGAQLQEATDLGRRVLQGWIYVPFNVAVDVTVVYSVGPADMHASNGRLDLLWQKQAGRPADPITVEVSPPTGWKLTGAQMGKAGAADPVTTDLSVDRAFAFTFASS